jgi:hypothetical protein
MKNLVKPSLIFLLFVTLCSLPTQMLAQLNSDTSANFSINIEMKGNNATLSCNQGCNWKKITLKDDSTTINENGIVSAKDTRVDALFLFNVQKNAQSIHIDGIKGTKWGQKIIITCIDSCKLVLNQFGLAQ